MKRLPRGLVILYEDRDILVVDKPAGLLTIATHAEKERTAYFILTDYVRRGSPRSRNRIVVVHRLDRETSGVLVFAKSEDVKYFLQARWPDTEKKYLAVVHGRPREMEGTISTYLAENRAHVVYSTDNAAEGKLSRTAYKVLRQAGRFSLLEVALLTGRKHQIRVHLADQGHPVVGDRLYGRQSDAYQRMALHAKSISFTHPSTGERLTFEAEVPAHFDRLVGRVHQGTERAGRQLSPAGRERCGENGSARPRLPRLAAGGKVQVKRERARAGGRVLDTAGKGKRG